MEEETPLERLWRMDPVSRHEVHGGMEGHLEELWEACEKFTPAKGWLDVLSLPKEVREALARLNKHAERVITNYTTPSPCD